jgi:hypothetical protein
LYFVHTVTRKLSVSLLDFGIADQDGVGKPYLNSDSEISNMVSIQTVH